MNMPLTQWTGVAASAAVLYIFTRAIYNAYLHPLASFPGPKLWAAFRFPYVHSLWTGSLAHDVRDLHRRYGDIVRVGPDELSFAHEDSWLDIYGHRPGRPALPKNPIWWQEMPSRTPSIVSTLDPTVHSRQRKLISNCFSKNALRAQESVLQGYVHALIQRLEERVAAAPATGAVIDMVEWLQFTTCDIIGDLVLGESFGCLEKGAYHEWIAEFFAFFKIGALAAAIRFYPWLNKVIWQCLPRSLAKKGEENMQFVVNKVHKRMSLDKQRNDFMSEVLRHNAKDAHSGMSIKEIEATFNMMIMAGSETTGTALAGIFTHLLRYPDVLQTLVGEIRGAFTSPEEMTITALEKLPYLTAVIQEGLRLCPPIPTALSRIVPKPGATVAGTFVPAGTQLGVHQWSTHYSPRNFHRADRFIPERWLRSNIEDPSSPFFRDARAAVQPFLVGPTMCLGKDLAWAEMRLILARVLSRFNVAQESGKEVKEWFSQRTYVIMFKHPLWMRITENQNR